MALKFTMVYDPGFGDWSEEDSKSLARKTVVLRENEIYAVVRKDATDEVDIRTKSGAVYWVAEEDNEKVMQWAEDNL